MTYEEMMEELNTIPMFGAGGGLANLRRYLEVLGHPERSLRVIHVAGTNGKGSVCAFMDSVLREAGYKTALFTSPHLMRINERFRINFKECEDELLIRAYGKVKKMIDQREALGLAMLTYFEIMFLMSLLIFTWEEPDYCIMETGLGGRLDATVLTDPILCVITSISLDHTALLGDTIPLIAAEKAGIIKESVPVVYLDEDNGASSVICEEAAKKDAQALKVSYEDVTFLKNVGNTIDFSMKNRYYRLDYVNIPFCAPYQMVNAALAMTAIHHILPEIDDEVMRRGIHQMRWPGRMEEIAPRIYIDGAHNPGAIREIERMMKKEMEHISSASCQADKKDDSFGWKLLFAVCADKDYENMISMLAAVNWKHVYITKARTIRGAEIKMVEKTFHRYCHAPITIYESSQEAFLDASTHLSEDEKLLCLGSLYLVGELKEYIQNLPTPVTI